MKFVDEMPEEGQFVAVWTYCGELWSHDFRIVEDGSMEVYIEFDEEGENVDDFVPCYFSFPTDKQINIKYIIKEEL